MLVKNVRISGRQGWLLDNETLSVTVLKGGGHIAAVRLNDKNAVNPLWTPSWRGVEPWRFRARLAHKYGDRLLASICGHNVCLAWFGEPSPEEAAAGMPCHGEAPVARWQLVTRAARIAKASITCRCELPAAQIRFTRTLRACRRSNILEIEEVLESLARRDLPFTMAEHVTFGPPFLEKGITVFDMSATLGHTFPQRFGRRQRLQIDTEFIWPHGPGQNGRTVDLRTIGREYHGTSDFSTQLMDPRRDDTWFSALNPHLGLLMAYVWRREDFPWVGNWEENHGRQQPPWNGKSLARGMEFANTPFPIGLRPAVQLNTFQGEPTYRWLPARGRLRIKYWLLLMKVPLKAAGVKDIRCIPTGIEIDLRTR